MKAQSMIDSVLLVITVTVIITLFTIPNNNIQPQSIRYQSTQHQTALQTILNKQINITNTTGQTVINLKTAELIAQQECTAQTYYTDQSTCKNLEQKINQTAKLINPDKNYILQFKLTPCGEIRVYNKQPTVCLNDISVAKYEYDTQCGNKIEIIYGTWFKWMNPPQTC